MGPFTFDFNQAVNLGGIWLGPMLGPVVAVLVHFCWLPYLVLHTMVDLYLHGTSFDGAALGKLIAAIFVAGLVAILVVIGVVVAGFLGLFLTATAIVATMRALLYRHAG